MSSTVTSRPKEVGRKLLQRKEKQKRVGERLEHPNVVSARNATTNPLLTLFAIPKPFTGDADRIQKNAIESWATLQPNVEVLLIGDEPGIADAASQLGVRHVDHVRRNAIGTPLVSSAFEIAHRETSTPFLAYCNADVILLRDFSATIARLAETELQDWVAFGRRIDLRVDEALSFESQTDIESLLTRCKMFGQPSSIVCKEYFVFSRNLYQSIPEFAVGRGNWDNWMIHFAKQQGFPVVDISSAVTAIHQSHDYSHVSQSRWKCYVSGPEARLNEQLAGGRHLIRGSTATWKLTDQGVHKIPVSGMNVAFWRDSNRFLKLMKHLVLGGRE